MDLKLIADAATIVGSLSIFLTLIFVGYELKENVYQSKLANRSNRDLLFCFARNKFLPFAQPNSRNTLSEVPLDLTLFSR